MKNIIEGAMLNESIVGIPADQLEQHRSNLDAFGESYIRVTAKTNKTESIATILKRKGVLHNATIDSSKFHNAMLCSRCGCECKKETNE